MGNYETKNLDVVYFVREGQNEELRYSLRSVEKNLPHHKVWIIGGKPADIKPDEFVRVIQNGMRSKWDNVRANLRRVGMNEDITEDFILMNDDFFINKPIIEIPPYFRSTLYEHIVRIEMKYNDTPTEYTRSLRKTCRALEAIGAPTLSYELHVPIILNRHKLLETIGAFPDERATRTLYGNYHRIGGTQMADVKVVPNTVAFDPDATFLSTDDSTFGDTPVGKHIKSQFPQKSRFEL